LRIFTSYRISPTLGFTENGKSVSIDNFTPVALVGSSDDVDSVVGFHGATVLFFDLLLEAS
jgi:hypothetical protein